MSLAAGRSATFLHVSFAEMGLRWPDASVLYDRDVASRVADPIVLERWDNLYVASVSDPSTCWCWMPGGPWEDLGGGRWLEPHARAWQKAREDAEVSR